jgi:CPA2 family monovalent cation:H+ antiporter-2
MTDAHDFLQNLTLVLCTAAVTTVLFQKLRQPVVFGYLAAGVIVGPHVPIPLAADERMVQVLAELGVILLMFYLGLEFSLRRLLQVASTAGVIALATCSAMLWIGFMLGRAFGWTTLEAVYAGAIISISSTTIIAKAFDEQGVKGKFVDVVLGVLIIEDLIAIFLVAILTVVSSGGEVTASSLGVTFVRLATFLTGLIVVGLFVIPRLTRGLVRMGKQETTLIAIVGICFGAAMLALSFGYSVALGAFLAGSLVSESGEGRHIEHLVKPLRDVFAAIFFVAVGMTIDPALIAPFWAPVLAFTLAVIIGNVIVVSTSAFLTGYSPRTSVQSAMSLAQIGEFSFIIAGVGLATGATRPFLYSVAVAVSAITTLTTPWLIHVAGPTAAWVDRRLPHRLQTLTALYGSWMERMRSTPTVVTPGRPRTRRLLQVLLIDAVLIAAVVLGAAIEAPRTVAMLGDALGLSATEARWLVIGAAVAIGVPLLFALLRTARLLAIELALKSLPAAEAGKVDFAAAPRGALVVMLQIAIVAVIGIPIIAITQPFLPAFRLALVLVLVLLVLGVALWQSAANLQGHARAGGEIIATALSQQMSGSTKPVDLEAGMSRIRTVLPGLGEPESVRVPPGSMAVGRTLAAVDLRGLTGATVLAIIRAGEPIIAPTGKEVILEGDVLAVAGSHEAIVGARSLIEGSPATGTEVGAAHPDAMS